MQIAIPPPPASSSSSSVVRVRTSAARSPRAAAAIKADLDFPILARTASGRLDKVSLEFGLKTRAHVVRVSKVSNDRAARLVSSDQLAVTRSQWVKSKEN